MVNSRFRSLYPDLSTPHADLLESAYPGYRLRRIYRELMSRLDWWCYGPVWNGRPLARDAWRRERVGTHDFAWLLANAQGLFPQWHSALTTSLAAGNGSLHKGHALLLVRDGLLQCAAAWPSRIVTQSIRPSGPDIESWQKDTHYPRKSVVQSLLNQVRARMPDTVHAALLHGSVADGHVADGFSDCDLSLVLDLNSASTEDAMLDTAEWLMTLNRWLLAYNPASHHGPMLMLAQELDSASPARLPPVLLRHGLWLGPAREIHYEDDPFACIAIPAIFEQFFERQIRTPLDLRSLFDAIWWTANTNILPCLLVQLLEGHSIWKADVFASPPECLPAEFHPLLTRLDAVRRRIGQWAAPRLPDPVWPLDDSATVLPGACIAAYKHLLAMTPQDVADVGIDQDLIDAGRRLWEHVTARALDCHASRLAAAGASPSRLDAWPGRTTEVPRPAATADYRAARAEFIATAAQDPGVKSVYEFGSVGCPGLSDLDFLVVLRQGYQGMPGPLTTSGVDPALAALMGHDPIFIGEESAHLFGGVFPLFHCQQIYGDPYAVPTTETFPDDVRAVMLTVANLIKYPRDIIWLTKQPAVRWTTLLAYLNSFKHVARCLEMIDVEPPAAVRECVALNEDIRRRFLSDGRATVSDLAASIPVMLRASTEMTGALETYWRQRIPALVSAIAPFRPERFAEETRAAFETLDEQFPTVPPALAIVGALSTMTRDVHLPASDAFSHLDSITAPSRILKQQFADQETAAGRPVSGYIRHPSFHADPPPDLPGPVLARMDQLHSPRFERFMFAINAFAVQHGLRAITEWSKVWEYPWLWFNALQRIDWRGKVLADLSSELSPMPWFLACQGARIELIETHPDLIPQWTQLQSRLRVQAGFHVTKSERLPLPDASVDVVTSFSVIEHQPDKKLAIDEVVRVLKPGGTFAISFDVCEPSMGMTFPEWNGRALTMRDFETLIWLHPAFGNTAPPKWNISAIPQYLDWHRQSAPHHNYATAAAVLAKKF